MTPNGRHASPAIPSPQSSRPADYPHASTVWSVAFSPKGDVLATGSDDRTARIWPRGSKVESIRLNHPKGVREVVFSPNGNRLATICEDNVVRVWDLQTRQPIALFPHTSAVTSLAFLSGGSIVRTVTQDKAALTWSITTGKELASFKSVVSANGDFVLTTGRNKQGFQTVSVSNALRSNEVRSLEFTSLVAENTPLSPDGRFWVGIWGNSTTAIWDSVTRKELAHLEHSRGTSVVYSPNGQLLATMGFNAGIRIWDVHTGKGVAYFDDLKGDAVGAYKVAFSPSGRTLFVVQGDTVYRYMLLRDDLIHHVCEYLPFNMPSEIWSRYLPDEPFRKSCPKLP